MKLTLLKTIFLFALLSFSLISLHSKEKTKYKCAYEVAVLSDTIMFENYPKDTYIVQINGEVTKGFYYKQFYVDSLKNTNIELYDQMVDKAYEVLFKSLQEGDSEAWEKASEVRQLSTSVAKSILYKNYKQNEIVVVDEIAMIGLFTFTDELQPQDWKIQSDTMTVLGYHSQKATCRFRGRNWIAWFTNEIPLSEGPWKFYGLPGLITKVADDKGHYSFTLTGFQELEESIDTDIPQKAEKTTREKFLKMWRQEEDGKYGANITLEKSGVTSRPIKGKSEEGRIRYDYIETDYKEL